MSVAAQVAVNTISSWIRFLILFAVQIALIPYIIGKVGAEDYGLWALTLSVLGLFMLLDFGLAPGVVKYVGQSKGSGDVDRRNRMVSTIAALYGALGLLGLGALSCLAVVYGQLFDIPKEQQMTAIILLLVLGGRSVLVSLPFGLFRGALFGEQRIYLINIIQIGSTLLMGVGTWLALHLGYGLIGLAVAHGISTVIEHIAYVVYSYRHISNLRVSWRLVDRSMMREATSFGVFQFLASIAGLIILRTDPIIIKLFLSLEAVTVYAVALKVTENVHLLVKQFINVLTSLAAKLKGEGDDQGIRNLLYAGSKLALAPAAMLAAGAWAFGTDALVAWVGPEFESAGPLLIMLMTAVALQVPISVVAGVFSMTGLHRFTSAVALTTMIVNLVVSLALVKWLGLMGVALGTLSASALVSATTGLFAGCRLIGISYFGYLRHTFLPAMAPAVVQYAAGVLLATSFKADGLLAIVGQGAATVPVYLAVFWLFLKPSERDLAAAPLRGLASRLRLAQLARSQARPAPPKPGEE